MTVHKLKVQQQYFEALFDGTKTCEVRYNDRDYQVGDLLVFAGSIRRNEEVLFGEVACEVTHILPLDEVPGLETVPPNSFTYGHFGQWVVLSFGEGQ
jgi:hypothetical protein